MPAASHDSGAEASAASPDWRRRPDGVASPPFRQVLVAGPMRNHGLGKTPETGDATMTDPVTEAESEILRLHREWFAANLGLQGHLLRDIFAGERFFDFNLNGYRYDGITEMEKLWSPEHMPAAFDLQALTNVRNLAVVASGDIGWLTCEADCVLKMRSSGIGDMAGEEEIVVMPFRMTECYRRDDGEGAPTWRMWHFHCSAARVDVEKRFDPQ
jgi:hypothetical protein